MRYSFEPRDRIYVKGFGFMSFAKNLSNKQAIQKTAEATGDLIDNKIADKITSISKKSTKKLPTVAENVELATRRKRYIRQQIIDELRLVPKN